MSIRGSTVVRFLTPSPSECCFPTRKLLQQLVAARDVAEATAFHRWALQFFCLLHLPMDTGTNFSHFVSYSYFNLDRGVHMLAGPAHARAVQSAIVDPPPARLCDNPPIAHPLHLMRARVRLTIQDRTQALSAGAMEPLNGCCW